MSSLNKTLLIGNLTRDPELRYTASGQPVCTIGLAINRNWTDKQGQKQKDTTFLRVTVWGKTGESCAQYLKKGRAVFVEGRLQTRSWETDAGEKRSALDVVADSVQFLGGKQDEAPEGATDNPETETDRF